MLFRYCSRTMQRKLIKGPKKSITAADHLWKPYHRAASPPLFFERTAMRWAATTAATTVPNNNGIPCDKKQQGTATSSNDDDDDFVDLPFPSACTSQGQQGQHVPAAAVAAAAAPTTGKVQHTHRDLQGAPPPPTTQDIKNELQKITQDDEDLLLSMFQSAAASTTTAAVDRSTTQPPLAESTSISKPFSSLIREHPSTLGVVREPPVDEGTEFSRFGLTLKNPRQGAYPPRENSRELQKISPDETNADEQQGPNNRGGAAGDSSSSSSSSAHHHRVYPGNLPYDDPHFAEEILRMEVEGALDETWQDGGKAHLEDVEAIVKILREMKVRDIVAIDVSQKTSSFDYVINGTCEGTRHIHLASWAVSEADRKVRQCKPTRVKPDNTWDIVPIGRIVVNLMLEKIRTDLSIERKWVVTKNMDPLQAAHAPISEGRNIKSHGLWTLTMNLQDLEDFEADYCKEELLKQVL